MSQHHVMLFSAGKSFVTGTIAKQLSAAGFDVLTSEPDPSVLQQADPAPDRVLLYLDGNTERFTELLSCLKELQSGCVAERLLYLIGSEEDLDEAGRYLPRDLVEDVFLRPLNVTELTAALDAADRMQQEDSAKKRILVIDDDGTMLRTLKLWLSDSYRVYMANSGKNAMSLLEKTDVDLILLDYEMPEISGPEVFSMFRADPGLRDIPVMFLTAKDDPESAARMMSINPENGYLLKTQPPDVVREKIAGFFQPEC